jgi:four helix bundle protein
MLNVEGKEENMKIKKFEDIKAWKHAEGLTVKVYKIKCKTAYGIDIGYKDQIQRACISIMSNIAEGFERDTNKEFIRFLYFAKGSCAEVRSLLHIGQLLGYISGNKYKELLKLAIDTSKLIAGFIKYLKSLEENKL